MNPILFPREPEPVLLQDSNSYDLADSNGNYLSANGEWYTARDFSSFGGGILPDTISCYVGEERNGEYELEMKYPMNGWLYDQIENRSIIVAKANDKDGNQPFRIYRISRPINGVVTINARHISYDLTGVPSGMFTASNSAIACAYLDGRAAIAHPFTISADFVTAASFAVTEPTSVRSWLGGKEGSLIDIYGGEWYFNGYTCRLMAARGTDKGAAIKYGVNMTDFEQEENIANMYTGVLPYWTEPLTKEVVSGNILYADGNFDFQRILSLDLSETIANRPTLEELTAEGRRYMKANNIGVPEVNITVEWVPELANVALCDTVKVVFEKLGIEATAKVVKTTYDVLKERFVGFQIGSVKPTIADNIAYLNKKAGYYGT